ncbi:MAG TPA: pyridoxal-phosphate dependent enzyme, partial [Nocardioides sp.]|nr:pyridoxal-phosphate dependent enzyme [Nocardioides sp.]
AELVVAEVDRTAPLTAALAAEEPVAIDAERTFVDGAGSPRVRDEMWPLLREAVSRTVTVTVDEVKSAVKFLAEECHVIAEGARALGVAAALAGRLDGGPVACVVSGGNIDMPVLADIVGAERPGATA